MFKGLLDISLLDEEEILELDAENRKNSPELDAALDELVGLIFLTL